MLISFNDIQKAEESQKSYEPGVYQVRIIKVEDKVGQNSGNPYLRVTFETIGENVFEIKNNYFFTEKSLSILLNLLSAIGLYEKGASTEDLNIDNDNLLGHNLKLELVLGEPNDQGKQYLEVKPWTCEAISEEDEIPF